MSESNRGEYGDVLADIMDRDEELRGAGIALEPDPGTPRWQVVLVAVLAVAFVGVLARDAVVLAGGDEAPPPAEVRRAAGVAAFAVAMEIEAFREREGRWPRDLAEIGFAESGLEYETTDDRYALRDPDTGQEVSGEAETDPLALLRGLDLPDGALPEDPPPGGAAGDGGR